jgi:hypothetical protein
VAASDGQVAKIVEQATGFRRGYDGSHKEIERQGRPGSDIVTFNSEVLRIDGEHGPQKPLGELEVLAPVVKRLTIEDGINVPRFNSILLHV